MDEIKELLIKKSLKEEVFRIDEFEHLILYFLEKFNLQNYISEVYVTSLNKYGIKKSTCAMYIDRILFFDYLRSIHSTPHLRNIEADNKSLVYFINLNIIRIILHELQHVIQEKKVLTDIFDSEAYILYAAYKRKIELINDNKYDDFYSFNPIERQAEIKAIRLVVDISRKNHVEPNYFKNLLDKKLVRGYDLSNPIEINPCKKYFDGDLSSFNIKDLDYDTKIELGLPVKKIIK